MCCLRASRTLREWVESAQNPPGELWKVCPSYLDWEASNYGRVKYRNSILLPHFSRVGRKGGYLEVSARSSYRGISKRSNIRVHELVADAWLGARQPGEITDHKDRDNQNNHSTNLRYVESDEDYNKVGKQRIKLTDLEIYKICEMLESGQYRQYEIADVFNTTTRTIRSLTRGFTYRQKVLNVFGRLPVPVWRT